MTEGLLLRPSLSLMDHLSKFPEWEPGCDCCEVYHRWKREHEKLLEAKVSQIQDEIDSLETRMEDCENEEDYLKLRSKKIALKWAKALLVSPSEEGK